MTCLPGRIHTAQALSPLVAPDALDLRHALQRARAEILGTINEDEVRHWCRWAALRLMEECLALAGSEALFRKRYPAHAADFLEIEGLISEPIDHIGRLLPLLKRFGNWLVKESERRPGSPRA